MNIYGSALGVQFLQPSWWNVFSTWNRKCCDWNISTANNSMMWLCTTKQLGKSNWIVMQELENRPILWLILMIDGRWWKKEQKRGDSWNRNCNHYSTILELFEILSWSSMMWGILWQSRWEYIKKINSTVFQLRFAWWSPPFFYHSWKNWSTSGADFAFNATHSKTETNQDIGETYWVSCLGSNVHCTIFGNSMRETSPCTLWISNRSKN